MPEQLFPDNLTTSKPIFPLLLRQDFASEPAVLQVRQGSTNKAGVYLLISKEQCSECTVHVMKITHMKRTNQETEGLLLGSMN